MIRKNLCKLILPALIVSALKVTAGTIGGITIDAETGEPLAGTHISLIGTNSLTMTDDAGGFYIDNIPAGEYKAVISHIGYRSVETPVSSVAEAGGYTVIKLKPIVYYLPEVTIEAKALTGKVYTGENIRRSQADNLGEFLSSTGELTILDGGGAQNASISIRGSKAGQTAVYLDGRLLNDPVTGEVDLKSVPLANVVEITVNSAGDFTKGGSGSAGAVELKTGEIAGAGLKIGYGSFGYRTIGAELGKKHGVHTFSVSIDRADYAGNYKYNDAEGERKIRLNDDYSNNNLYIKYSAEKNNSKLDVSFNRYNSDRGAPGSIENPAVMDRIIRRNNSVSANYNHSGDQWMQQSRASITEAYNQNLSYYFFNGDTIDFPAAYRIESAEFDSRWIKADKAGQFTGGISGRMDKAAGSSLDNTEDRLNAGAFLARTAVWKNIRISSTVRGDGYKGYGTYLSSSLNGRFYLGKSKERAVTANWSKGVTLPTFNDLFYAENAFAAPNPDLKPEKVESWDAGMEIDRKALNLKASVFLRHIKDMIIWQESYTQTGKKWKPFNTNSAVIKGIELFGRTDFDRWGIQASSTLSDPRNASPGYEDNYLVFQPALQTSESIFCKWKYFRITLSHRYISRRYILQANTKWAEAASLFDVSVTGGWNIRKWVLEGAFRIENLTDAEYTIIRNSPMPGRSYKITFNFTHN